MVYGVLKAVRSRGSVVNTPAHPPISMGRWGSIGNDADVTDISVGTEAQSVLYHMGNVVVATYAAMGMKLYLFCHMVAVVNGSGDTAPYVAWGLVSGSLADHLLFPYALSWET